MASNENLNTSTCVVCYKNSEYYSIGLCEHPVCYECSTRMRVLCHQNECPICRQDLPKVVFTRIIKPFRHLKKLENLLDTRYNIYFENTEVREKFTRLLAHVCKICKNPRLFSSFDSLKGHVKSMHNLYYCDLCVENLKIFSDERRCYTKSELNVHRQKGDPDDRSHKGHPICEFCEKHYMDTDELFRHLRRDHLFCHLCDADGYHQYYSTYDYLRDHFRREHFLCEEADCAEEQFTRVFRTEIDLKAHKTSIHGKQLGKAAAKQARTLELEFTLAPRSRNRFPSGPSQRSRYNGQESNSESAETLPEEPLFVRQPLVDVQSTQEFPSLGNATPVSNNLPHSKGRGNVTIRSTLRPQTYNENFPALGIEPNPVPVPSYPPATKTLNFSLSNSSKPQNSNVQKQQNTASNLSIRVNHRTNGSVTTQVSGPNIRIQPGRSIDTTDFPALSRSASSNLSSSNSDDVMKWTKISCVKAQPRTRTIAPPPLPPSPPPIESGEDYPSLSKTLAKSKKKTTVSVTPSTTVPVTPSTTVPVTPITTVPVTSCTTAPMMPNTTISVTPSTSSASKTKSEVVDLPQKISLQSSTTKTTDTTKGKTKKKKKQSQPSNNTNTGIVKSNDIKTKNEQSPLKVTTKLNNDKKKIDTKIVNKLSAESNKSSTTQPINNQRKRSELKIENLNSTNNNKVNSGPIIENNGLQSDDHDDFSALSNNTQTPRHPPGFTSPPPGFTHTSNVTAPPPGFFRRPNSLTFTSSSGQTYNIVPEETSYSVKSYIPPADFQERNRKLVDRLNNSIDGSNNNEKLKTFRFFSTLYRSGDCSPQQYYDQCRDAIHSDFEDIFPELLALLPDTAKQRDLYALYQKDMNKNGKFTKRLEICGRCGQVVQNEDLQSHVDTHTFQNQFPALSNSEYINEHQKFGWSQMYHIW